MGAFGAGAAHGRLTGGNLATICALMGTPYEIETDDCILFLEDIGERPYRVDRCLSQLRLAGKLENLAGVLLGWFTDCEPEDGAKSLSLDDVFADYFGDLGVPVCARFPAGHDRPNLTLPLGATVEIDADCGRVLVCGK